MSHATPLGGGFQGMGPLFHPELMVIVRMPRFSSIWLEIDVKDICAEKVGW